MASRVISLRKDPARVGDAATVLDQCLGRHRRGAADLTHRREAGRWWRASTTPEGSVMLSLTPDQDRILATAEGSGSAWALAQLPRLLGEADRGEFAADHVLFTDPVVGPLARRGLPRIGSGDLLLEVVVPTVIEQRVTGAEAFGAYRRLVSRYGTPAPGAGSGGRPELRCPPTSAQWAEIPSWEFLRAGIDHSRRQALQRVLQRADSLQRLIDRQPTDHPTATGLVLERALRSIPGIGPWTSAKVRQGVVGDPDAWSIDDYHVPDVICRALSGDRGESRRATELLARFAGQRYRVELLLAGLHRERRGPRRSLPTHLPSWVWSVPGEGEGRHQEGREQHRQQ